MDTLSCWKALRAGAKQGGATQLLLNGPKIVYFGTNFINWGWIGFATAPAMATATATATTMIAAAQPQLGGFDHDCCGSTAAWWLQPRQRLRPRLRRLNDDGDYAAAMVTIAEPKSVDRHHFTC